jgi:hypothetical protein
VAEGDPAAEDPPVDRDARGSPGGAVLPLDVLELGEDVVLGRQEHAPPVLDAADEDLLAGHGATGL